MRDRRGRYDLPTSAQRREAPGNTAGRTPRRGCHPAAPSGRGLLPLYTHACGGEVAMGHAAPLTPAHGPSGDAPALISSTNQPARHGRWRGQGTETARRRVCITAPSPTALDPQHAHPPGPGTCRRRRKCVVSTPRGEFGVDRHRGSQRAARPQTSPRPHHDPHAASHRSSHVLDMYRSLGRSLLKMSLLLQHGPPPLPS